MRQSSCAKKIGGFIICLIAVAIVATVAFVLCCQQSIIQRQEEIQSSIVEIAGRLDVLEGKKDNLAKEIESSYNLADQVSVTIGIITAGITVFTLFGGILTIFNIIRAKDLDETIAKAEKVLETQQELLAARLLQEGRIYILRGRIPYAANTFKQVIKETPDTISSLIARYELLLVYSDTSNSEETEDRLCEIQEIFYDLIDALGKPNSKKDYKMYRQLIGDAYFTLGCVYGKYATNHIGNYIDLSEQYLKEALRYNSGDVDYHRNLAYTYAMANNIDKCKKELETALDCANLEPLFKPLVSYDRLQKLFKPIGGDFSLKMREMIIAITKA